MKKKKTLIISMLLGIMLLTSCGKTDHQDQAPVATEQTSGDSRQTTEEPAETVGGSEESTEAAGTDQAAAEAVETTDFQWALYNQNGELCVEATTDISQAESGVTLLLTGDGNLDDVQEIFE